MISEQSVTPDDFPDESPLVGFLLKWSAEIASALVGSMLGSDFGELQLGTLIGLGLGAAIHIFLDLGAILGEPYASADF